MLSILKTTSQNFGLAIQDQISIKHKLENIEGLPTLELDFLSTDGQDGSTVEPTERPNLHQKQQIAKNALEKKYKVRFFFQKFRNFKGKDVSVSDHNRRRNRKVLLKPFLAFILGATKTFIRAAPTIGKCSIYNMETRSILPDHSSCQTTGKSSHLTHTR